MANNEKTPSKNSIKSARRAHRPTEKDQAAAEAAPGAIVDLNAKRIARAEKEIEKHPALNATLEKLFGLVKTARIGDAQFKYEVGRIVGEVRKDKNKYGKRSVKTLAILLECDKSRLNDYANVAETWSAEEFAEILQRQNGNQFPPTFSHLIELARLTTKNERDEKLEQVVDKSLTVHQLHVALFGRTVGTEVGESESEPAEAQGLRRTAATWGGEIDQLTRKTDWVIDRAKSNPVASVLDELRECARQQRAIATQASKNADELDAAVAELEAGGPASASIGVTSRQSEAG
jgi:hypothetical protein